MKHLLVAGIIFFLFSSLVFGQKISIGAAVGDNVTLTSISSSKNLGSDHTYSPGVGYNIGIITKKDISEKVFVAANLFYEKRRSIDKSKALLIDETQQSLGNLKDRIIINDYLKIFKEYEPKSISSTDFKNAHLN